MQFHEGRPINFLGLLAVLVDVKLLEIQASGVSNKSFSRKKKLLAKMYLRVNWPVRTIFEP